MSDGGPDAADSLVCSAVMFSFSSAVIYISAAAWSVCDCVRVQLTALWWGTFLFAWLAVGVAVLFPAVSSWVTTEQARGLQMMKEESDISFFSFLTVCSPLLCLLSVTKACSKAIIEPKQTLYDPRLIIHCDPNKSTRLKVYHEWSAGGLILF